MLLCQQNVIKVNVGGLAKQTFLNISTSFLRFFFLPFFDTVWRRRTRTDHGTHARTVIVEPLRDTSDRPGAEKLIGLEEAEPLKYEQYPTHHQDMQTLAGE